MIKLFTSHPNSIHETYTQHLKFAVKHGVEIVMVGLACILHGIFPFIFVRTTSNTIAKLADKFLLRTQMDTEQSEAIELSGVIVQKVNTKIPHHQSTQGKL